MNRTALILCLLLCTTVWATIPEQTAWETKNCDGGTTGFTFSFTIQAATDLKVLLVDTTTTPYTVTTLTVTTHYSLAVANGRYPAAGGTVTTVSTYAATYDLVITTDIALTETGALTSGSWNPLAVQRMIYKSRLIDNELQRKLDQAIHNPDALGTSPTTELPQYGEAGYLYRSAAGNISLSSGTGAAGASSNYWEAILGETDLANSVVAMGLSATVQALMQDLTAAEARATLSVQKQMVIDVTEAPYNAAIDGLTDDTTALTTAEGVADDTGAILFIPAGTLLTTTSVTISSNVDLMFAPGGTISVANGETLTITGGIRDTTQQIFTLNGSAAVSFAGNTRIREFYPQWFGATGDGVTDDTAAIQAAVDAAEAGGGGVVFFPEGTYDITQVFIDGDKIALIGNAAIIVQNHDATNSIESGGAGQYKVSAAFFLKRGSDDIIIDGFKFQTDDGSFPVPASGYESYFPCIAGQINARVTIRSCHFDTDRPRAIFFQGGSDLHVENNYFDACGATIHVGYTKNIYFYDDASETTDKYSPLRTVFTRNTVNAYAAASPTNCWHLTGCVDFVVSENQVNINAATADGIRSYANDNGPYDATGTALGRIDGKITNNSVTGTFLNAIRVDGYGTGAVASATWNASYEYPVVVSGNTVTGTGTGIYVACAKKTKIVNNEIETTASPLSLAREIVDMTVTGNTFECLTAGGNQTTIYCNWVTAASNFTFSNNKVITPTGDQYAIRSTVNLTGLVMRDNVFDFNSDVASCRPIVMLLGGHSVISGNQFDIDTDTASVLCLVLTGNSNAGTLVYGGNSLIASAGTGAATLRQINAATFKDLFILHNSFGGAVLIEDCTKAFVHGNVLILPASQTLTGIDCDNTGYAAVAEVYISENSVTQTYANTPAIRVKSNNDASNNTTSIIANNKVSGTSSASLIQQTIQGRLEAFGNTITNAGAGGTNVSIANSAVFESIYSNPLMVSNGATSAGYVDFYEDRDNGSNYIRVIGPASTGDVTLTLPSSDGDAGQILSTDGSGVMSWTAAGSGDITSVWGDITGDVGALTAEAGDTLDATLADTTVPWRANNTAAPTVEGQAIWDADGNFLTIGDGATTQYLHDWTKDQGATNIHANNIPDLSATYQAADADLTDLADGSLTASKVAGVADADYGDVVVAAGVWTVQAANGDLAVTNDITNGTDIVIATKTIIKTISLNDDGSADDYQFDDDAANTTEQVITLTNILPAYAEMTGYQLRCFETVTGGAALGLEFGTSSGGNELAASANIDTANEIGGTAAGAGPILAATNAARSLYVSGTPGANWNTLNAGRWSIMLTYVDYAAVHTQKNP